MIEREQGQQGDGGKGGGGGGSLVGAAASPRGAGRRLVDRDRDLFAHHPLKFGGRVVAMPHAASVRGGAIARMRIHRSAQGRRGVAMMPQDRGGGGGGAWILILLL